VDARPAPDVYDDQAWELAAAYRVTLWEQPATPPHFDQPQHGSEPFPVPFPGATIGWERAATIGLARSARAESAPGLEALSIRRLVVVAIFLAVRPVADQLLVRTGEMARRQEEGPNRKIFGAMARYLPALSGMRLL
jgi:hypothetical protein